MDDGIGVTVRRGTGNRCVGRVEAVPVLSMSLASSNPSNSFHELIDPAADDADQNDSTTIKRYAKKWPQNCVETV